MLWSIDSCQNRISADRTAGSSVDPSRSSTFLKLSNDKSPVSIDHRLKFFFSNDSCEICCVYVTMAPQKISNWPRTRIQNQSIPPAPTPSPPAFPRALAFFLPWMANSREWELFSCQIARGGDEKKGQMPRPPSTLQHFSLIAQSNNSILSIWINVFLCNSARILTILATTRRVVSSCTSLWFWY